MRDEQPQPPGDHHHNNPFDVVAVADAAPDAVRYYGTETKPQIDASPAETFDYQ